MCRLSFFQIPRSHKLTELSIGNKHTILIFFPLSLVLGHYSALLLHLTALLLVPQKRLQNLLLLLFVELEVHGAACQCFGSVKMLELEPAYLKSRGMLGIAGSVQPSFPRVPKGPARVCRGHGVMCSST